MLTFKGRLFSGLALSVLLINLTSCASIINGTRQDVGISSSPTGASVTIDNIPQGKTPLVADLRRKDNHVVKIELPGYAPYEAMLTKKASGWVWGNIVFGGLIGLVVDVSTGGMYKLTPEEISVVLQEHNLSAYYRDNSLYIAVVLTPDPAWEQIGTLEKTDIL